MSLQVWLPLTHNTNNQGLSNITVTNMGSLLNYGGIAGKCYGFDGVDDRIACSSHTWNYPISICGWFKPFKLSGTQYWISYSTATGGTGGHAIGVGSSGTKLAVWFSGTSLTIPSVTLSVNKWYHVVVVIDAAKAVHVYVNGNKVAATPGSNQPAAAWLTLGARSNSSTGGIDGAADFFNGQMSDVRLYDNALSARAIKRMARAISLHYLLNEDGINTATVYDSSGYQRNGIITGDISYNSISNIKYNAAIELNSNSYVNCGNIYDIIADAGENLSVNVWAYKDDWSGNWIIYSCENNSGFSLLSDNNSIKASIYTYADTSVLTDSEGTDITFSTGGSVLIAIDIDIIENSIANSLSSGWHMFTFTFDISETKVYIDGELVNTISEESLGYYLTNSNLYLGSNSTVTTTLDGQLSDFRIYSTTLTANEILSLYQNEAFINNSGNIYGKIR